MTLDAAASRPFVTPDQLGIGLYVHLDLAWTEHPFAFSSFKIKTAEQIAVIRGLGLARIRYNPDRSDAQALVAATAPPPEAAAGEAPVAESAQPSSAPPAPAAASTTSAPATASVPAVAPATDRVAGERPARPGVQPTQADACQAQLVAAAHTVRLIGQNVFSQPGAMREAAEQLIRDIAASMLVDADVSIRLMADRVGGEDVHFHTLNVSILSMMLARELKASPTLVRTVGMGALFHDIGELEVPDRIVRHLEPLTKAETALLQLHGEYGVNIARKMRLPADVQQVIQQHHELVDGSGYPKGTPAAQMSLPARIVSLVNAYDELCNPPNPAQAMTPHEALSNLFALRRDQFDAQALGTFVRCMGVYPPGTVVSLSDGAIALVTAVNTRKPLRPVVVILDSASKDESQIVDLDKAPGLSIISTMLPHQMPIRTPAWLSRRKRMTYYFDTAPAALAA